MPFLADSPIHIASTVVCRILFPKELWKVDIMFLKQQKLSRQYFGFKQIKNNTIRIQCIIFVECFHRVTKGKNEQLQHSS